MNQTVNPNPNQNPVLCTPSAWAGRVLQTSFTFVGRRYFISLRFVQVSFLSLLTKAGADTGIVW